MGSFDQTSFSSNRLASSSVSRNEIRRPDFWRLQRHSRTDISCCGLLILFGDPDDPREGAPLLTSDATTAKPFGIRLLNHRHNTPRALHMALRRQAKCEIFAPMKRCADAFLHAAWESGWRCPFSRYKTSRCESSPLDGPICVRLVKTPIPMWRGLGLRDWSASVAHPLCDSRRVSCRVTHRSACSSTRRRG